MNNLNFIDFISQKKILTMLFSIILSFSFNNFVTTTIDVFIDPVIDYLFGKKNKDNKIKIGDLEIELGKFIKELFKLIFTLYFLYFISKKVYKENIYKNN